METYFSNMKAEEGTREKLVQDLMTLLHDAEDLVKAAGENVAEKSKEELIQALQRVKTSCRQLEAQAAATLQRVDDTIRTHPYQSMGVAFGLGLLVGVLATRGGGRSADEDQRDN